MKDSLDVDIDKESGCVKVSLKVFNSPHSMEKSAPLVVVTDSLELEMEMFVEVEPTPLLCYPTLKFLGKEGSQSSERVLQLVKKFSHFVGLLCDGYERKLSALFADIIAKNEENGAVSVFDYGKERYEN